AAPWCLAALDRGGGARRRRRGRGVVLQPSRACGRCEGRGARGRYGNQRSTVRAGNGESSARAHRPVTATALIGREQSLADASSPLPGNDVRLLTITGAGGIGKTRLAMAVAAATADEFADGVVSVPLQTVTDPGLVVGTIARSLGLFDFEGDLEQRLIAHV